MLGLLLGTDVLYRCLSFITISVLC